MAEQLQKGFAEVNGTSLYYEVAGEGHPLVLNHGGLVDHHLWDGQFDAFAQHFKVIRYDIRGFGASGMLSKGMEPYSMERDLHSLLQFLGIEKTYVLGLSLGGTLAIDFTLQYPEMVDALITVGSGLSGFEWGEPDQELMAKFAAMGVRAMTTHNYERGDDEDVQPQEMEPPAAGRLSEIRVPVLIIAGGQDAEAILKIADTLEKSIAGAKKVVIPGTAHHPNMEKPQEFNRAVIEFLEQLR